MHRSVKTKLGMAMVVLLGVALPGAFLAIAPAGAAVTPTVTGVSPDTGPLAGGTVVAVTGSNFVTGATTVNFGFTAATDVQVLSSTSLTAVAPAGKSGSVDVLVTVSGQTSTASLADLFAYGLPTVTGLTPSGGPAAGGTSVIVNGTSFVPGLTVAFGGVPATGVILRSSTSITAVAPAGSSGWVDVTVTTPAGTSATSSLDRYAYDVPSVEWISPDTGSLAGGSTVTVVGSGFDPGATVKFGTAFATDVVVKSATALTAVAPAGTSGSVDVTVTTAQGTSAPGAGDLYAYGGPPSVNSVLPDTGPATGGTPVTIVGADFTAGTQVRFGGADATQVAVTSASTITATTPAGSGSVDVTVTTSAGTSATSPADLFAFGPPSVSGITPPVGPGAGGTAVVIFGSGFAPGATVSFGPTAAAGVTVNSATSITAVSPLASAGPVDVTVTTPSGTSGTGPADVFTYGDLDVTAVSPSGGPAGTATPVTITGDGFTDGATVQFGATPATDVDVLSPNTITATSPALGAGVVDVTVSQGTDVSPTSSSDLYAFGGPSVSAVSPNAGAVSGGEMVTITGTGFVPGSSVAFGFDPSPDATVLSDTQIAAVAPTAPAGTVDVTVTSPAGTSPTSAADQFTADDLPTVSRISPNNGPSTGGTVVTISGSSFTPDSIVEFGSRAATEVAVDSSTTIMATSPSSFANAVDVTVVTPGGISAPTPADLFSYGPPTVRSVEPDGGPVSGGTFVAVTGTGFVPGATVTFGSTPATDVTVLSATHLTAVAPAEAAGAVDVLVTTPAGTSSAQTTDLFGYGPPTVSSLAPSTGPTAGGTLVMISGTGFTPDATVTFGSTPAASVDVQSGTEIFAVTPSGTGAEDVQVQTPGGESPSGIDFIFGGPAVTSVSPDSGPTAGGNLVTISGTLFSPDATVQFGSAPAVSVDYVSPTSLLAVAPAVTGSVDVTVTTAVATSPTTVNDLYAGGAPSVTSVDPDGGPLAGGTSVDITGTGFVPGATVAFGTEAASSVTVNSGTEITATAPAHWPGSVDVTVNNGEGTSPTSSADGYMYGPPSDTGVSPNSGPSTGGTSVTVTGTGFTPDAKVLFGTIPASSVSVQSATSLTAVSPAISGGVVDVFVDTPGGDSTANTADQFAYNDQLEISCSAPPYTTTTAVCPGINLPAINLNGAWQSAQAPANTMYITDNRGDASAGWSVSAYMVPTPGNPNPMCDGVAAFCNSTAGSDSANPDAKIPSSYLSIGNVTCTATDGNSSPDPQGGADSTFPTGEGAVSLCTANAGQSAGTFKLGATFSLSIPPWVYAGQYQATIEYLAM